MKVLTIINSFRTGGGEKIVSDLLPLINSIEDVQMDLLLLDNDGDTFLNKNRDETRYKFFSLARGSVYNPLLIFKIIRYLRNYDIIHVHLFPALYWVAFAKFISFSKVKLVYTEHSTYNRRRNKFIFKYVDKVVYSAYDKIVCISNLVYKNLNGHLCFRDDKFVVIANGINLENIKMAAAYNPQLVYKKNLIGRKYIIQVSSFRYPKDQRTLIKAMTLLPSAYQLILIGDGPLKSECERFCKEVGLEDRVLFLGKRPDVFSFLKMADVVVLSSYYEGLSLSSIEGMASGNPFVASRVPGLEDIVSGAGILFAPGDCKELANIIRKLCDDLLFRNKVIKDCLERSRQFDINKTASGYIHLYKNMLHPQISC